MNRMQEPGDTYLNDMIDRAMEDDRRSAGYGPASPGLVNPGQANPRPGNPWQTQGQAQSQIYGHMRGQAEGQAQGQTRSQAQDQSQGYGQDQASGYASGQGTQTKASPAKGKGKGRGSFLKGLISGTVISDSIILKDVRYSALIALLAIIFIANRFNAERVEREITALEQEVRDLRAESLSVSADLGSVSRQSEITDLVKERGLGLEVLREPPYRIVVNE